ncbi:MAG: ribosome maturation factor RimP [candidate division Zixibacteria bacterium]|nr:ribosome maturation factor RimP [candidate division Zixibacteria bacterium]
MERLRAVVEPVAEQYGVELVDVIHHLGRNQTVRILIDKPGGITLDDCTRVSRRLSADFDMAEVMPGRYTLEVSSPGLDRPLRTPADFRRKMGHKVALRYEDGDGKRRALTGVIAGVETETLTIGETQFEWNRIVEGKLVI